MLNLILGPSGAGKTSLIDVLVREKGWIAIESIVTRPARDDDRFKKSILPEAYELLRAQNKLWSHVEQLGYSYGIAADDIRLATEDFSNQYVLDFNFRERAEIFGSVIHRSFALLPESKSELERRLVAVGRKSRIHQALIDYDEIREQLSIEKQIIHVVNAKDRINKAVDQIHECAMASDDGRIESSPAKAT